MMQQEAGEKLWSKIISYIKTNRLLKSILMVSGGTLFAQILTTVTTPIITRIYSTEQYGVLTTYNSVLSILGIAGAMKYELSIPIAESEDDAYKCYLLSLVSLIVTTSIITGVVLIGGKSFLEFLGAGNLHHYWYMIPLGIFFVQYFAIVIQYSYRNRDFKRISLTSVKQSIVGNVAKIVMGLIKIGPIGLLLSRLMSDSVGAVSLTKPILKKNGLKVDSKSIFAMAKRYRKFPIYQLPGTIIGQIVINMPVFYFGIMFDDAVIGIFGLANTIVNLPMDLIGKSVGNVFYAEAAKLGRNDPVKLKELSNDIIKKLSLLGLVPLFVLLFFAPWLFSIVFGTEWTEAGVYARILAIGIYFTFVFTPTSRVFEVYEKQTYGLVVNIFNLVILFGMFTICRINNCSIYVTLGGYVIVRIVVSMITFFLSRKFINEQARSNQSVV